MSQFNELQIQAAVTKTAVFTGAGVSVAALTGDWTLHHKFTGVDANTTARVVIEESQDGFVSDIMNLGIGQGIIGPVGGAPQLAAGEVTWRKKDVIGHRFGQAGTTVRAKLNVYAGTAPGNVSYETWVTYSS